MLIEKMTNMHGRLGSMGEAIVDEEPGGFHKYKTEYILKYWWN